MQIARDDHPHVHMETLLPLEWERLVRLCAHISGCAEAAEDLAQEAMIEAWRNAGNLRNPEALRPWLSGIARNVCLRWRRRQGREATKLDRFTQQETTRAAGDVDAAHGGALMLERDEAADLLDRAMGMLPASTRDVLVQHYIDERPHAEIAERLRLSESAVAVRIHRGKRALKQALVSPELGADAAAFGLTDRGDAGWQVTRVWCPFCGQHRLSMCIDHRAGMVGVRCSGPCFHDGTIIGNKWLTDGATGLTSAKSILRRELLDLHEYYRQAITVRGGSCHDCGHPYSLDHWPGDATTSPSSPYAYGVLMTCGACGSENSAPLSHLLLDTPVVQQFWRRHPRVQVLPVREIDMDGRAALLCGFASVDTGARIEIVSAADTYDILQIEGAVVR